MSGSTARALAVGGGLITVLSLLTPWYVLRAGDFGGLGKSGAEALGTLGLLVVALAIAAGWSLTARAHALLPPLAAAALLLVVVVKLASPPDAASALSPNTGDDLGSQLADAFASAFASGLGLHYEPAWGIWLAMIGATAALVGTIGAALQNIHR
jgi:hypothetical protein